MKLFNTNLLLSESNFLILLTHESKKNVLAVALYRKWQHWKQKKTFSSALCVWWTFSLSFFTLLFCLPWEEKRIKSYPEPRVSKQACGRGKENSERKYLLKTGENDKEKLKTCFFLEHFFSAWPEAVAEIITWVIKIFWVFLFY